MEVVYGFGRVQRRVLLLAEQDIPKDFPARTHNTLVQNSGSRTRRIRDF